MTAFNRGIQLYLLLLAFVATLTIAWGTNLFLLGNTTTGTGWPIMVGIAGLLGLLGVVVRRRRATDGRSSTLDRYRWSSDRW